MPGELPGRQPGLLERVGPTGTGRGRGHPAMLRAAPRPRPPGREPGADRLPTRGASRTLTPVSETAAAHPLAALTGVEIAEAVALARGHAGCPEEALIAYVGLHEPPKDRVRAFRAGDPLDREVRLVVVPGPQATVVEAVVSVTHRQVRRWDEVPEARPALLIEEAIGAIGALRADPDWQARCAAGASRTSTRSRSTRGRRATSASTTSRTGGSAGASPTCARRPTPTATPGRSRAWWLSWTWGGGRCSRSLDTGVVPIPPDAGSYYPEDTSAPHRSPAAGHRPARGAELHGRRATWCAGSAGRSGSPWTPSRAWSSTRSATRTAAGCVRSSTGPRSARWWCPTARPDPMHAWKSAFDVGEWGLGRMANSLDARVRLPGRDPLLRRRLRRRARPPPHPGQRHLHARGGLRHPLEARRPAHRRGPRCADPAGWWSAPSPPSGNYEYGFYWYFYLDGTMQLEVKLTGIMSTQAVRPARAPDHAVLVAPRLAAPYHQHLFNVRLDVEVDGPANAVYEVERPRPESKANTFAPTSRPCSRPSWRPSGSSTPPPAATGRSSTAPPSTGSASRPPTSWCRDRRPPCWPIPSRAWVGGPASPPATCG